MPFTPTHIAAILPVPWLSRSRLPLSALVIGSMIPDLPLFLPYPLSVEYRLTHTIAGVFLACLPLGMCLFLWFQCFAKRPLTWLLPSWIRARIGPYEPPHLEASPRFMLGVAVAVVFGAATHVFWDSFTHRNRWGFQQFPQLGETVFRFGTHSIELYEVLQHGCTIVFIPIIVATLYIWLRRQEPSAIPSTSLSRREQACWRLCLLALPNIAALAWSCHLLAEPGSFANFARSCVTTAGLTCFVCVNVYAGYIQLAKPAVRLTRQDAYGAAN
jgi:hypothetical protein